MATKEPTQETVLNPEETPGLTPLPEGKKTAVIVAGGNQVPKADITIVVETATFKPVSDEEGAPLSRHPKKQGYPTGAQTYVRYDPDVKFPADAPEVITVGVDVQQLYFRGFTRVPGFINVGPAHPAYVGANLAFQRGASQIEIVGLSEAEKELLKTYFDDLPTHPAEPAQVAVSFT